MKSLSDIETGIEVKIDVCVMKPKFAVLDEGNLSQTYSRNKNFKVKFIYSIFKFKFLKQSFHPSHHFSHKFFNIT